MIVKERLPLPKNAEHFNIFWKKLGNTNIEKDMIGYSLVSARGKVFLGWGKNPKSKREKFALPKNAKVLDVFWRGSGKIQEDHTLIGLAISTRGGKIIQKWGRIPKPDRTEKFF